MTPVRGEDLETVRRHRQIWQARPELRGVYREWFGWLREGVRGLHPVVEVGAGPGFFKSEAADLIATDLLPLAWLDVVCDACRLPFRSEALGALVMVDALHHLAQPLAFMEEAARVLRPRGRLAMVEPWITPLSYLLYRYLHHEKCQLDVDLANPFAGSAKSAFAGNAAIPFKLLRRYGVPGGPFRLVGARPFVGLPYLVTFGFKRETPLPLRLVEVARACERWLRPLEWLASTRVFVVLERVR